MTRLGLAACWAGAVALGCGGSEHAPGLDVGVVGSAFSGCSLEQTVIDGQSRVRLAPAGGQGVLTSGEITCDYAIPHGKSVARVAVLGREAPAAQSPSPYNRWPLIATDVITQIRTRRPDGTYGAWQPRNILDGGDFADPNGNGVPDQVNVLAGDASEAWSLLVDLDAVGAPPPDFWLPRSGIIGTGTLVDLVDHPVATTGSLHLHKPWTGGQQLAMMTTAMIPPAVTWTVSGWNRYEKGADPDLMTRFHENDSAGASLTKYVLLGDDDFHTPTGNTAWTWRALTFTSEPRTVGISLIPARLTATPGDMWAAGFEIREGSVFSPKVPTIFQEDFASLDAWEISDPSVSATVELGAGAAHALQIAPAPHQVVTATLRTPIPVREGVIYAFQIAMENRASASYDTTHDTWVSCYLEFFDESMRFLDFGKAQVFRPVLERPVAAAATAPPGARYARFLIAALHKTYSANVIDGTMLALFSQLRLQESPYDPAFQVRPVGNEVVPTCEPDAIGIQVRSRLLTRDPAITPSLAGFDVQMSDDCRR